MNDATHVRVDLHYTKNLGNYESLRIGIAVEDFLRQGESVDAATERVYEFVESKLVDKVKQVTEDLNNGK
jgi:hypothetical protein